MDYALLGSRNPSSTWEEVQSQRRKNKKVKKITLRSRGRKSAVRDFWSPIRAVLSFLIKMIILAGCSYAFYTVYLILTTSPQFAVMEIHFEGNKKLQENHLMKMIENVAGQNIFLLNLEDVTGALVQHPWIRAVSVKKVYPQNLQIQIVERKPYSRIQMDEIYVMDNFGVLLDRDGSAYRNLPLIVQANGKKPQLGQNIAGEGVIRSLKTMHYFNRLPFFRNNPLVQAEIDDHSRITFFTLHGNLKIFMALDTISESFKNFMIVLDTIESGIGEVEHIDLSFRNQVVVKHRRHSRGEEKKGKETTL